MIGLGFAGVVGLILLVWGIVTVNLLLILVGLVLMLCGGGYGYHYYGRRAAP